MPRFLFLMLTLSFVACSPATDPTTQREPAPHATAAASGPAPRQASAPADQVAAQATAKDAPPSAHEDAPLPSAVESTVAPAPSSAAATPKRWQLPARCKLPPKAGNCRARFRSYYFDPKTK